jgi:dihydroorotate dehydrogenase
MVVRRRIISPLFLFASTDQVCYGLGQVTTTNCMEDIMRLRGIDFGYCWDMSGVRGFFGEGYTYHKFLKPFGLRFAESTFVSKTATMESRRGPDFGEPGNMRMLEDGITPAEFKPDCIRVDFRNQVVLNAVGLSGPGVVKLFEDGRWQARTEPWVLSFASTAKTVEGRVWDFQAFLDMLRFYRPKFRAPIALQQNFFCVNVEVVHEIEATIEEAWRCFELASTILPDLSQVPKLSVLVPPEATLRLTSHPACDGVCVSNTVLWGQLPDRINWKKYFDHSGVSPLAHLGGGGLSGKDLLPPVLEWVQSARGLGLEKPIAAGGGVLAPRHADYVLHAGADAVAVGSMSLLRPWNMQRTINRANREGRRIEMNPAWREYAKVG